MTKSQDRKEYRKNLTSSGQIRLAGETLDLKCYDVSVNGIMAEVFPGKFLSRIEDFEAQLNENNKVEIFIENLMFTGEAVIAWVKEDDDGRILVGLEHRDVKHNLEKLWLKRLYFRKKQPFFGTIMLKQGHIDVQGINISIDGMAVSVNVKDKAIKVGNVFILEIQGMAINKVLAKVIWINEEGGDAVTMGLRYFELNQ